MNLDRIPAGDDVPKSVNVLIEIPMRGDPVKYEVDKDSGALFVDRLMSTAMHYPCNYGYVPHTLSGDGDPVDVLVISPYPLITGVVVRCRPVGMLRMDDEAGEDTKVVAVPIDKVFPAYSGVQALRQLPEPTLERIAHFFEHYKDLEKGKWVKLDGWGDATEAKAILRDAIARYEGTPESDKPHF